MSATCLLMYTLKLLGVVMELELTTETHHCPRLFYCIRNAVPRFCTCISDRFQAILHSVVTCQKDVTFMYMPGFMLMSLCKQIAKFMKAKWGKFITRFINKCQQFRFKKIMQLKRSEGEKNRSRRCR